MEVYRATLINPTPEGGCRVIRDGGLVVSDGRIQEMGEFSRIAKSRVRPFDFRSHLILPGFVDTHVHLPQMGIAGIQAGTLLEWLEKLTFPAEEEFNPEKARTLSPLFFREMIRNGTTTAAVYSSSNAQSTEEAFKAAWDSRMRVIMGNVLMDRNAPKSLLRGQETSIPESDDLFNRWDRAGDGRLHYAYTPRFAIACSEGLMASAGQRARDTGAYVQTHLSENKGEIELVNELFPAAVDYTDVYDKLGLLQAKTILAHCIHLSPRELAAIKKAKCGIAHCPTSNVFLNSGIFPMGEVMKYGIPSGLGSDVGGGPTLSLFEVMRQTIASQRELAHFKPELAFGGITPENVLFLATLGGARAMSLDTQIGSLDPGKKADFMVLDRSVFGSNLTDEALLSRVVYFGNSNAVSRVYIDGQQSPITF